MFQKALQSGVEKALICKIHRHIWHMLWDEMNTKEDLSLYSKTENGYFNIKFCWILKRMQNAGTYLPK